MNTTHRRQLGVKKNSKLTDSFEQMYAGISVIGHAEFKSGHILELVYSFIDSFGQNYQYNLKTREKIFSQMLHFH